MQSFNKWKLWAERVSRLYTFLDLYILSFVNRLRKDISLIECFIWKYAKLWLPVHIVLSDFLFYLQSTDPADKDTWKDRGTGQLSIKCKEGVTKGTKDSKPTVLVRNDVCSFLTNYCSLSWISYLDITCMQLICRWEDCCLTRYYIPA